jgi:TonB family protein
MAQRIKYRFLQRLFDLFAFLSEWSGGRRAFVQPKMLLGSLLLGMSITACQKEKDAAKIEAGQTDSISVAIDEDTVEIIPQKPIKAKKGNTPKKEQIIACYDFSYNPIAVAASFPGGEKALQEYLNKNLVYPRAARVNEIEGRVVVEFYVEEDGSISDIRIEKSVDELLDHEAIRVVKRMLSFRWIPAMENGKPVRQKVSLPIDFVLDYRVSRVTRVITCYAGVGISIAKRLTPNYNGFYLPTVNNEILRKIGRINAYGRFECELTFNGAGFLSDYFIIQSLDDEADDRRIIAAIKSLSPRNSFRSVTLKLTLNPPSDFVWELVSYED